MVKNSPKIFAIDSLGNVKWSWEGPFSMEENLVTGLHRSANNFWYYNTYNFEYRVAEQAYYWQPKFVKRDSNFNLVWSRPVGEFQSFFNGFNYSFPTQNGEWMAVGNTLSGPKTLSGWMYRMSTGGDSLWSRLDTAQASGAIACETTCTAPSNCRAAASSPAATPIAWTTSSPGAGS
ncbi:MAG: hypothetical protein IPM81_11665 [Saprospirales bacterium]|nr:hypothetical protein [Saprospirales bacterium]